MNKSVEWKEEKKGRKQNSFTQKEKPINKSKTGQKPTNHKQAGVKNKPTTKEKKNTIIHGFLK